MQKSGKQSDKQSAAILSCQFCRGPIAQDPVPARCPHCLRHLVVIDANAPATVPTRGHRRFRWLPLLVLGLAVTTVMTGWLIYRNRATVPARGQLAMLDGDGIVRTLMQRGVPESEAVDPFVANKMVRELALPTHQRDRTQNLDTVIARLARAYHKLRVDLSAARVRAPLTAEAFADELSRNSLRHVLSFDLAVLTTTILREAGFVAVIAVGDRVDAPVAYTDPTGAVARYWVVVYPPDKLGKSPLAVLDPARVAQLPVWAIGDAKFPKMAIATDRMTLLDDASVAGHFLVLKALCLSRTKNQVSRAYDLLQWGLRASAVAAVLHGAEAVILQRSGGIIDAQTAAQTAVNLSKDPPRRTLLARLLLRQSQASEAVTHLEQAIKDDPEYWPAHQLLTRVRWASGEVAIAQRHFDHAQRIAPDEPAVLALRGAKLLLEGKGAEASAFLMRAVEQEPDESTLVQLYIALKLQGDTQKSPSVRKQLLTLADDPKTMAALLDSIDQAQNSQPQNPTAAPKLRLPDVSF